MANWHCCHCYRFSGCQLTLAICNLYQHITPQCFCCLAHITVYVCTYPLFNHRLWQVLDLQEFLVFQKLLLQIKVDLCAVSVVSSFFSLCVKHNYAQYDDALHYSRSCWMLLHFMNPISEYCTLMDLVIVFIFILSFFAFPPILW